MFGVGISFAVAREGGGDRFGMFMGLCGVERVMSGGCVRVPGSVFH